MNPGDYHRYHSPADIVVKRRNHILGYLAPVKESYISTHEVNKDNSEFTAQVMLLVSKNINLRVCDCQHSEFTKEMRGLQSLESGNLVSFHKFMLELQMLDR